MLVIGLGEVGRALFELLKKESSFVVYGLDLDKTKLCAIGQSKNELPTQVDTMHVCLPCEKQDSFVSMVIGYAKQFLPKLLIINSTVPPGTTKKIAEKSSCLVAHSPIRGVHKNLEYMQWELKRWVKYVGGANTAAADAACKHFEKLHLKVKKLKSSTETELAKLFETTYRAWMIACFQEIHRISRHFNCDFDEIVDFIEDTHRLRLDRPVMFPGVIGGHCLIPNTELLLKSYDSEFLHLILKSNEKRKEEIKDKSICEEMEKIKKRVEALQKDLLKLLENSQEKLP